MASLEGTRSPFPTQPSTRSPKLRIYEHLFPWNQGVDHVVALLRDMEKFPFSDKESVQSAVAEVEEVRSDMNADFIEHLADSERFDEGRFSKQRHAFEKKWRDPDDVYIDVERREEERKKQGCRHVSALSLTPLSPKKNNGGKRSKSGRKSGTRSAGSKS
jgi:hypothetical protein